MTDSFEDRKRAAEAKWAHDEELHFKVMARRARLAGLWAAGVKGISGAAAETYAKGMVSEDLKHKGHEDLFRKLRADLGTTISDAAIREKMDELAVMAHDQIIAER